jgi:hypothetical protein
VLRKEHITISPKLVHWISAKNKYRFCPFLSDENHEL